MPTDTWTATTIYHSEWALMAPSETYSHAVSGVNPVTGIQDFAGFVATINTLAGVRFSGYQFTPGFPSVMNITEVKIISRVWGTAVYGGTARFFIQLANGLTTTDNPQWFYGNSGTDWTSAALAHPGGGSWTKTDLENCIIGLEGMGDGPWDGNPGSGGEVRAKYLRLQVTYTAAVAPVAAFAGTPREIFEGSDVDFNDLSVNAPTSWAWDFENNGSTDSTNQNETHNYPTQPAVPPNNTFDVKLTATNVAGSDDELKLDYITVWKTTDNCIADFVGAPLVGYAPLTVQFYDQSKVLVNDWSWDFGDLSAPDVTQNPQHIYTDPGFYDVELTVGNGYTTDVETKVAYIEVQSAIPEFDFAGVPTSGSRPLPVQFTFTLTGGVGVDSWLWDFGDGTTSVLENPLHTYRGVGDYTVSCTATNEYGSDIVTKVDYITVNPVVVDANFEANITTALAPGTIRFRDLSTGDALTWDWDFGDGVGTSTERNPTYTYRTPGVYDVTLVVNIGLGTEDTETKLLYITIVDVDVNGAQTYLRFLWELQMYMMRPDNLTPCDAFAEFGGIDRVLEIIHDRIMRFQLETGTLKTEATLGGPTSGVWDLPQDLIELRRVEVNGERVESCDQYSADRYDSTWETATANPIFGYIVEPSTQGLKLQLVPYQANVPTINVDYVYTPLLYSPPSDGECGFGTQDWGPFPLPYVFWWIIRFGVEADLMKQEGELYDVDRAKLCEEQWAGGIEIVKALHDSHGVQNG